MAGVLVCLSASHRTASFAVLEALSSTAQSPTAYLAHVGVRGCVVVATCNRFEAYLDIGEKRTSPDHVLAAVLANLAAATGVAGPDLQRAIQVMRASRVAAHLFAVASGLESVVVGENEIAGQVRRALAQARDAGTTTFALERLFQMAATTSRDVKNTTALNAAGRSMVRLALDLAESRLPPWAGTNVLIIGTGAYARTTLAALRDRGAHSIRVASPSGREATFAAKEGVGAVPAAELAGALGWADLVITSTTVRALDAVALGPAREHSPSPLLVVDLGLPSNVDKDVAALPGTTLLDLETVSLHAPVQELNASAQARDLVHRATREFETRTAQDAATPAIVAFRTHITALLDAEIERARSRGDAGGEIERALRHFAGALVHAPSERARELAAAGRAEEVGAALAALYGIELDAPQASSAVGH